ncbi:MAG: isopentenyl-diphosphate delta-isomerase, isopentenyl-diphosphate delta-isomerase [Candidatus Saccharibacteria bacterium]|nr:isopentenyl-diphosphate delta-isomerase, isopentenyl-diphosphate delta-isomerase [Candidatus Saccharibacteria bacterium]
MGLAVEGTVEEGETYESNIRKEAEEEIGIILRDVGLGLKFHRRGKYNHFCQVFVYYANLDIRKLHLQMEEVEQVAWYDISVLQQEAISTPNKFGYKFKNILDAILPNLST